MECATFEVAPFKSAYHASFSLPALAKFGRPSKLKHKMEVQPAKTKSRWCPSSNLLGAEDGIIVAMLV